MKIAKIGALVAAIAGVSIASGSYATAVKLLHDTLNVVKDSAHPNLIIIPQALFKAFEILIQIRVVTLNATGVVNVLFQLALGLTQLIEQRYNPVSAKQIQLYKSLQEMLAMWADAPPKELAKELVEKFEPETLAKYTGMKPSKIAQCKASFWGQQLPNAVDALDVIDEEQPLLQQSDNIYGASKTAYQLQVINP
jgi:hypothetical protein